MVSLAAAEDSPRALSLFSNVAKYFNINSIAFSSLPPILLNKFAISKYTFLSDPLLSFICFHSSMDSSTCTTKVSTTFSMFAFFTYSIVRQNILNFVSKSLVKLYNCIKILNLDSTLDVVLSIAFSAIISSAFFLSVSSSNLSATVAAMINTVSTSSAFASLNNLSLFSNNFAINWQSIGNFEHSSACFSASFAVLSSFSFQSFW
mmetsp:Transcript_2259/g.6910  ORF Transcript_2259/g.6910 Transcript_2259/m.6910 type:complete len:205 (-) Transcript_2259:205-819(-)